MNYLDKVILETELKGELVNDVKFVSCRFAGTNLKFSAFTKCIFENCDFTGVIFDGTKDEQDRFVS